MATDTRSTDLPAFYRTSPWQNPGRWLLLLLAVLSLSSLLFT